MFVTVVNTRHPYWRGSNIIYIYYIIYYIHICIYVILRGEDLFFHMVLQYAAYLAMTQIEKPAHLDLDVGSWWEC